MKWYNQALIRINKERRDKSPTSKENILASKKNWSTKNANKILYLENMINHPRKWIGKVRGMVIKVLLIYELGMIKFHMLEFYVNKDGRSYKRGSHHLRRDTTNLLQSSNILVVINYILPQSISTHVFTHCHELSPHLDFKHHLFRARIDGGTHNNGIFVPICLVSLWLSCWLSYC